MLEFVSTSFVQDCSYIYMLIIDGIIEISFKFQYCSGFLFIYYC